eukprot:EG_transcript_26389
MINVENFCVLVQIFPSRHFFGQQFAHFLESVYDHGIIFRYFISHGHKTVSAAGSDTGNSSSGVGQGRGLGGPWLAVVLLLYMEQDLLASGEYDYCVKRLMASRHVEGTDYFLWEAIQLAHPDGLPFLGRLPAPKVSHYHPLVVRKRAKAVQLNLFEEAPEAEVNGATKHFQIAETASGEFYFGEQGPPTDAPPR